MKLGLAIRGGWRPTTLPLQTCNQYEHFYAYMEHCNVTLSEQYELHKVLYAAYPDHYPSTWWMLGQAINLW